MTKFEREMKELIAAHDAAVMSIEPESCVGYDDEIEGLCQMQEDFYQEELEAKKNR